MDLSVTTDYATSTGNPGPYLQRIAAAGFTHIHWCHQWNTDFLYAPCEVEQIESWLRAYGIRLLDLHASHGQEKAWAAPVEYQRRAGVDLVTNRVQMAARLGSDVIIMHVPGRPDDPSRQDDYLDPVRRSLAELQPVAQDRGVRIALENGDFRSLGVLLEDFGPEYVGLCYDSGHGNMIPDGLEQLERYQDRLISVHLHDNDGAGDQHKLLFSGTVDWPRLARILGASAYGKCVSMEVVMRNTGITSEEDFLCQAYQTGSRFARMVDETRAAAT